MRISLLLNVGHFLEKRSVKEAVVMLFQREFQDVLTVVLMAGCRGGVPR